MQGEDRQNRVFIDEYGDDEAFESETAAAAADNGGGGVFDAPGARTVIDLENVVRDVNDAGKKTPGARRVTDKDISKRRVRVRGRSDTGVNPGVRPGDSDSGIRSVGGNSGDEDPAGAAQAKYNRIYRRRERGRRILALMRLLLVCFLLYLGVQGGVYLSQYLHKDTSNWLDELKPVSSAGGKETIFTLENGWTLTKTAAALYEEGLIRDAESFVRLGKQENRAESIKAGRYKLSSTMSSEEILDELVKGSVLTVRFTIPEGFTLRQIAKVLIDKYSLPLPQNCQQ